MVYSPKLVKRYQELKEDVPDCLLVMQAGAFMQVMDKDARAVSEATGLKLRMAREVDAPVVLGGFPNQRAGSRLSLGGRVGSASALYVQ